MKPLRAVPGGVIAVGVALVAAVAAGLAIRSAVSSTHARAPGRGEATLVLAPAAAPAGWHRLALPNGSAVLSYPPIMRPVPGDSDAVSAARFGADGRYLLYLNATPRQGEESQRNWASYRLRVLRSDAASRVGLDAVAEGQRFLGGTGSCVVDHYVTRVGAHRYTELACLVQGRTAASVIVAAAPTALWPSARPILYRAVSAYTAR